MSEQQALIPEPKPVVRTSLTEADVLAALHARFAKVDPVSGAERAVFMTHVASNTGFVRRRLDALVMQMWESTGLALTGIEVKVSRSDWLRELKDPTKAAEFADHCDHFLIAAPPGIVKRDELPAGWGLIEVWKSTTRMTVRPKSLQQGSGYERARSRTLPIGLVAGMVRAAYRANPDVVTP